VRPHGAPGVPGRFVPSHGERQEEVGRMPMYALQVVFRTARYGTVYIEAPDEDSAWEAGCDDQAHPAFEMALRTAREDELEPGAWEAEVIDRHPVEGGFFPEAGGRIVTRMEVPPPPYGDQEAFTVTQHALEVRSGEPIIEVLPRD
jgi:hypothetical protein